MKGGMRRQRLDVRAEIPQDRAHPEKIAQPCDVPMGVQSLYLDPQRGDGSTGVLLGQSDRPELAVGGKKL